MRLSNEDSRIWALSLDLGLWIHDCLAAGLAMRELACGEKWILAWGGIKG
ncbi:hypothetical protein [Helicobacter canis]|nr:hypothetical protein [Helicobacter canis]